MSCKEGWKEYKLGEIAIINPTEKIPKKKIAKKIPMEALQAYSKNIPFYIEEEFNGGTKFRNGDTLVARITPSLENGKTAFVNILNENEVGFGSTEFIVLREKDGITDKHFLYYFAISSEFRNVAIKSMSGTSGRQRVSNEVVFNHEFELPPLATQRRIAQILSSLDEKIELNRQMNQTLEETAQTLFREMCLPKGEELPEGWEETGIGKLVKIQNGFAFKSNDFTDEGTSGIVKIRNISSNVVDIINTQFVSKEVAVKIDKSRFLLKGGDLLIAMTGAEVGKIGLIPNTEKELWLNQRVGCFKEKIDFANYFLYLLLSTDEYQSIIRNSAMGSAQPNISATAIEEIKAIIPTIEVINEFGVLVKPLFQQMLENYAQNEALTQLRDNLLPKLMNGEVDV